MKGLLAVVGAVSLLLWTGLGLLAWARVGARITVLTAAPAAGADDGARLAALADELGALHQDVRALASALGENLQALQEGILIDQAEHALATRAQVTALRDEVGSLDSSPLVELADLRRELRELREALQVYAVPDSASQLDPSVAPGEATATGPIALASTEPRPAPESARPEPVPASDVARPRTSFLAFTLPSDDFRFDERRSWTILPALSRVGFDARTTLHDFTATSSTLAGTLEADLSRPAEAPEARVSVQAASLVSGDADRDEAMREHLAVERFPTLDYELTGFEAGTIDRSARSATGVALGRLTIRGVTRDVRMSVRLALDESRRLSVEGEVPLDLTHYAVPVPSKLGLISMEDEVRVWISLRLRVDARNGL